MATYTYPGGPDPLTLSGAQSDTIQGDGTQANSTVTVSVTGGSEVLTINDAFITLIQTSGNGSFTLNNSALTLGDSATPQFVVFGTGNNGLRLSETNYNNWGTNGMSITGFEPGDGIAAPDGYYISSFTQNGTTLSLNITPIGDAAGGASTHTVSVPVTDPDGQALADGSLQLNADGTMISDGTYVGPAVCLLGGTLVSSERGEIAVENIEVGDKVHCLGGLREVRWVGYRHDLVRRIPADRRHDFFPVRIKRNAIADNVPSSDLRVSPWHHLYVDGVLVRAKDLVNGSSIVADTDMATISYYHVELDMFDVILSHGIYTESYTDGGNRDFFQNEDVVRLRPEESRRREGARPGFETVRDRRLIAAMRKRYAERAAMLADEGGAVRLSA